MITEREKELQKRFESIDARTGTPMILSKSSIGVDLAVPNNPGGYQRERFLTEPKLKKMRKSFSMFLFGALHIADYSGVPGGEHITGHVYNALDGNGRLTVAKDIPEVTEVPCMVYPVSSRDEAAYLFRELDSQRKNISPLERFNVNIALKDPTAIRIRDVLKRHGIEVSKGQKVMHIAAIGACYSIVKSPHFDRTIRAVAAMCRRHDAPVTAFCVRATHYVLAHAAWVSDNAPPQATRQSQFDRLWNKLISIDPRKLQEKVDNIGKLELNGDIYLGSVLMGMINEGLHYRFVLNTVAQQEFGSSSKIGEQDSYTIIDI